MADKLTTEQQAVVDHRGGNLLVSAAAGSGKTKVLVDRLMKYLEDPVSPANLDEFLIITYTKAAASELRGKIAAKLTEKIAENPESRLQNQMQRLFLTKISTVHSFCSDILREYASAAHLPADFQVAEENECRELRETVLSEILDDAYNNIEANSDFQTFVDTQGVGRNDKLVPELVLKIYDSAKCHVAPEDWLDKCVNAADMQNVSDASETIWGRYLMDDLMEYLDCIIGVMEACMNLAGSIDGLNNAAENLCETLDSMRRLRDARTWDQVVECKSIQYSTWPRIAQCSDPEAKESIKAVRDECKNKLAKKLEAFADPSAVTLEDMKQAAAGTRGIVDLVRKFDRAFSEAKKKRRILDYTDLEHKTLELLLGEHRNAPTKEAAEIAMRFREIMVDEYQDSNGVQDAIFSTLTAAKQNCFMVGDVKQSIYQFRLADPGIFLEKYRTYSAEKDPPAGQGRKILLSRNFRSGGEVIEAANEIFTQCMSPKVGGLRYGEQEALREGIEHKKLPDPAVEMYVLKGQKERYPEEAAFVAQRIRRMLDEETLIRSGDTFRQVRADDIVILLRSPKSSGAYFRDALEAQGIRCAAGDGNDLLQTGEISTLRAFLETIYNPRQDIPLLSVLASPVYGFTADELAAIRAKHKYGCFYDAILADESPKSKKFAEDLSELRRQARMHTLTELIELCFTKTAMDSTYAAMPGGEARFVNLQSFFKHVAEYEQGGHRDLGQFLDHLKALEEKGLELKGSSEAGCVTIMSIHKSKGLEFPVVFLCGMGRTFNQESVKANVLSDKELGLGLSIVDTDHRMRYPSIAKRAISTKILAEGRSEEMRVLYVAVTRARDRLVMTLAPEYLEKDLMRMVDFYNVNSADLLCRDARYPGTWLLMTMLNRIDPNDLFEKVEEEEAGKQQKGKKPKIKEVRKLIDFTENLGPWRFVVQETCQTEHSGVRSQKIRAKMPETAPQRLREALEFTYAHASATQAPSKQTATGRKGRLKDEEAAQDTPPVIHRSWRRPSFLEAQIGGKTYGSAMHAAMQFIRYEACGDLASVRTEIDRLVEQGFLTEEQGNMVNAEDIAAFFGSELGEKLRSGAPHLREFKFSILDDAKHYGVDVEGEQVLLQGVVDCALLDNDGITIIDFKTDRVTEKTVDAVAEGYKLQVKTYGEALSRIYEMPIKSMKLYFFRLNRFVEV